MRAAPRDRTSLDLRGLGPAVRAHAKARNMAVSSVARMALAKLLESSGIDLAKPTDEEPAVVGSAVKVTLRVTRRTAREIGKRAWASGLSQGAFVSALVDGAPIGVDHKNALEALAASTDRLASVAADLKDFARQLQRISPSANVERETVASAVREVRAHLDVAARLVYELRPMAAWRRAGTSRTSAGESAS